MSDNDHNATITSTKQQAGWLAARIETRVPHYLHRPMEEIFEPNSLVGPPLGLDVTYRVSVVSK
jgi:hypothetical protein